MWESFTQKIPFVWHFIYNYVNCAAIKFIIRRYTVEIQVLLQNLAGFDINDNLLLANGTAFGRDDQKNKYVTLLILMEIKNVMENFQMTTSYGYNHSRYQ